MEHLQAGFWRVVHDSDTVGASDMVVPGMAPVAVGFRLDVLFGE